MVAAKWFSEWYAFFGGEEMDVSRDDAATIWEAATRAVEARQTQTNTGSPKLPGWEDVSNEIRRHRTYTHPGAELVDLGIAKIVYDFIARQLRADA